MCRKVFANRIRLLCVGVVFMVLCVFGCLWARAGETAPEKADELEMFPSTRDAQSLGVLIKTAHGKVIVIDGGWEEDSEYLINKIKENGGTVHGWFLTHPHEDHAGALAKILREKPEGIRIEKIYCSLADPKWYQTRMPEHPGIADQLMEEFQGLPAGIVENNIGKGSVIPVDDVVVEVMNDRGDYEVNAVNNSCLVYRVQIKGQRLLFLGDLGYEGGEALLKDWGKDGLRADVVQMAHHGQGGVGKDVYAAAAPRVCLWSAPQWLWDNDRGEGPGSGPWQTLQTRAWIEELGVKENRCTKDGVIHMYFP